MARWLGLLAMLAAAWMVTFLIVKSGDPLTLLLGFGSVLAIAAICYFIGRVSGRHAALEAIGATPVEPPRSRWQFTLRELLLFMLAFCLLMALIVSSRRLTQTPFFNSFEGDTIVKAACSRLGLGFKAPGGSRDSLGGPAHASREMSYLVEAPPASESGRVVAAMTQEIEKLFDQHGCRVSGRGYSGSSPTTDLVGFSFDYERGATAGTVRVCSTAGDGKTWTLIILLDEFKK